MDPLWGIDLGGTKIEGVILESAEKTKPLFRVRLPTEAHKGYEHIIHQIASLIELMSSETGLRPEHIGLGHPGAIDPHSGLMKNANTTCLNGRPFHQDLEAHLNLPFRLCNDANCFVVAETLMGAVKEHTPNAEVVFGIIMGTGVGGGIVVDGFPLQGRHGIAGEWGHNFLDESGGECYCGKVGCVETVLAGPALERYYKDLTNQHLSLKQIVQEATLGKNTAALATLNRLVKFFGKALANVINILDPDVILIGGGVGNIPLLYHEGATAVLPYLFNDVLHTPILQPTLGDSAGVFGAALLGS